MDRFEFKTYNSIMELETQLAQAEENAVRWKNYAEDLKKERDGWISEYRAARSEVERLRRNLGHLMTWIGKEHPKDMLRLMDEMTQQDFINSPENLNRDNMIIGFQKP